jgi:tRNA threonylcarbamoyladenosine biosynthesis protein TsaE
MRVWRTANVAETRALGAELARELLPGGCLLLYGDLGAGKTVLAQGVAEGLGLDAREVQSPTFALLREHDLPSGLVPGERDGRGGRLAHLDLYRLSPDEAEACGFEEVLLGPGVKIVEWAERLPFAVPGALCLTLRETSEGLREVAELAAQPESVDSRKR